MLAIRRHGFSTTVAPSSGAVAFGARVPLVIQTQTPQTSSWFPNWPIMNATCVQGASPADADVPPDLAADKDLIIFTSFYPTAARMSARVNAMNLIRAQQDTSKIQTKFFQYLTPCVTYKVLPNPIDNERSFNLQLILDPINGHPNWKVQRVNGGGYCETLFAPTTDHQTNITVNAGHNTLNEGYAEAYFKKYANAWTSAYQNLLSGVFHDVFNQRPAQMFVGNGSTAINDPDYSLDGVADPRANFNVSGPGNGGRQWALGGLNTKTKFEARFPGKYLIPNGARWDSDYFDGDGAPPLPLSASPFYRQFEMVLDESVHNNLSFAPTSTGWNYAGSTATLGRLQAFYRAYHIFDNFLKLDSAAPSALGHAVYWFHTAGIERTGNAADLLAHRFMSLAALLVDRGGIMVNQGAGMLSSLDETLVEIGLPLAARSMGTLDVSTLAFTIRNADVSSGIARFYLANFERAIIVVRGDAPTTGAYPSADAAVSCTLPAAGTGMKWQRLNANTYVNPTTDRATRGQDTVLNSGADVVGNSISLKPWHAQMIMRVQS